MEHSKRNQLNGLDGRVIVPRETDLPPRPPGVRYVRVPFVGIAIAGDELRARVNRRFHWPMTVLALLVLPVLAIELFVHPVTWSLLWWLNSSAVAVIWVAFFIEFVIKVAIAESRIEYCKRNWLDIVIILLPVLRPLRVTYVARTTRMFTLRGVGMKILRYVFTFVIGLEATERLLERLGLKSRRDRKIAKEMTRAQLINEVRRLRTLCDEWEQWYDAEQAYLSKRGFDPYEETPPPEQDPAIQEHSEGNEPRRQVELGGGASTT